MSLPTLDFETYSEAGYYQDPTTGKWKGVTKTSPGLPAVGAAVYTEHPSALVLCAAYDLLDGIGPRLWLPGMPPPADLFEHIARGGLLEAHNSGFEFYVWKNICHSKMGWPELPFQQLRCSAAKCRSHSVPGRLGKAAQVLGVSEQKDPRGERLIKLLTIPQQATAKRPAGRCTDPGLHAELWAYCIQDIRAEKAISDALPDLSPDEWDLWLLDQAINIRGVAIDREALDSCISVVNQAANRYTEELRQISDGQINSAGELAKITEWLATQGVHTASLDSERVEALLAGDSLPPAARRVLEIRSSLGAASVKKLFAIERMLARDGRLHDLFSFCGADRTGRFCIAEGQPVLVRDPSGRVLEVPVESVRPDHELWDGQEWVTHGGVVASGIKEVMTYDGVTATPDHRVFTSATEYATLAQVEQSGQSIFRGEKPCPTLYTSSFPQAENPISESQRT